MDRQNFESPATEGQRLREGMRKTRKFDGEETKKRNGGYDEGLSYW